MSEDKVAVRETTAINSELERVHKELAKWRGKAFLLTPYARTQFDSIMYGFRPEFRVTYISPDPSDQQVYKLDNNPKKLVLTKIGLQLLEHLAGIKWIRIWNALEKNDPVHPHFYKAGAEGEVQDLDGERRNSICIRELDLRDESETTKKMLKNSPDRKQLDRARLNIASQTETLAKNKVRRELLGLQATFTPEELAAKPFVILKLSPVRDMNDPMVRKLTIMQQFGITSELYDKVATEPVAAFLPANPNNPIPLPGSLPMYNPLYTYPDTNIVAKPVQTTSFSDLLEEVTGLYAKKVRGGRSPNKSPLETLSFEQLEEIKKALSSIPDIKDHK